MFQFLFKYPWAAFQKGKVVLLSGWPVWLFPVLAILAAALVGWFLWHNRNRLGWPVNPRRAVVLWALQTVLFALLLLLLWKPALSVSALKTQQNVLAVVVDDSRSMAIAEDGKKRIDQAKSVLQGGLLDRLGSRFQVRLYRMGEKLEPVKSLDELQANGTATRMGDALRQGVEEASTLPLGAMLLLTDGADTTGGVGQEATAAVRRFRVPVHTMGFGSEKMRRDLEIGDVQMPARSLPDSRLNALVTYRQNGYSGQNATLYVREGGKLLASRQIKLKGDGVSSTEAITFQAGPAGARSVRISIEGLEGEENPKNNEVRRLVNVEAKKPRILYIEGEPRWEMKFIRRALEEDQSLELVSMLRTTQNKVYRQGISNPQELEQGFPAKPEELFSYQGIIIGTVEAGYFTPFQQELLKGFVDRRGGGVLFLGGRSSLSDGGWSRTLVAEILPVTLPERKNTFLRERASVDLTPQGRDNLICRLDEDPTKNAQRWKALPLIADYQEIGSAKPGAVVLAEFSPAGGKGKLPFLVTQSYGRGRTAVLASGGTWRWQMGMDSKDKSHEMFWQQLARWLVNDVPGHTTLSTPFTQLSDESRINVSVDVRDTNYLPASDASVDVKVLGPDGLVEQFPLQPDPAMAGSFRGSWVSPKSGSYLLEAVSKRGAEEPSRDVLTVQREDGEAENFRVEQNRELLERIAAQTGGKYWNPRRIKGIEDELALSEAGITVRENRDLWDMPAIFLALLGLKGGEWLLRRRWGMI